METAVRVPAALDPVTRYLTAQGVPVQTAFLDGTGIELGNAVELGPLRLVYRYEGGALLVCDISANAGAGAAAIRALAAWVRTLEKRVPEVAMVAGLVHVARPPGEEPSGGASLDGERLVSVYRKLGARCTTLDREWVQVELALSRTSGPVA